MEGSHGADTSYCTACGHAGLRGDHYCTECGAPLLPPVQRRPLFVDEEPGATKPGPAVPSAPVRRHPGRWWLFAAALTVVAGGAGFYLGNRDHGTTTSGTRAPSATTAPSHRGASAHPTRQAAAPPPQPQDRLLRIARQDGPAVTRLVNSWVPQLAALTPGAGDDLSWTQALAHFHRLKQRFPNVLLLDTGEWPHSYERSGMYAVVIPFRGRDSARPLRWCGRHDLPRADCAAKLIATTGTWADNFDSGPGPG